MKAIFVRKILANKHDAVSFYFKVDKTLKFTPGQFTELTLKGVGKHWFTISSPPGSNEFSITTRLTGSPFKNKLNELKVNDQVLVAEPMGDFVLPIDTSRPILLVAGGIGITPFLSMLKDGLKRGVNHQLYLLYAAAQTDDFIDLSKYKSLLKAYHQKVGRLDSNDILKIANKLNQPLIYISGPEPMVEALVDNLKKSGIKENRLVADYFPGYE